MTSQPGTSQPDTNQPSTSTPVRGWRSGKVVAVLLAVLSVAVMAAALRVSQEQLDFAVVNGRVDVPVTVNGGELIVRNVRVGNRLTREGSLVSQTQGMFVVLEITVTADTNRDLSFASGTLLTADGRSYKAYDSTYVTADTGFKTTGDVVWEVDPAHIDDLTLQIWESELVAGYQQRSRIHLGITAANADQWRAAGRDRGIEPRRTSTTQALP